MKLTFHAIIRLAGRLAGKAVATATLKSAPPAPADSDSDLHRRHVNDPDANVIDIAVDGSLIEGVPNLETHMREAIHGCRRRRRR